MVHTMCLSHSFNQIFGWNGPSVCVRGSFTSKNHPKPRSGRPRNRRQIDEMVELHNGRQFVAVPKQDTVCRYESALV